MSSIENKTDSTVVTETSSAGVATVRINRPEKLNALDRATINDLISALSNVADNNALRAVILTGAGTAFCVGGDMSEFQGCDDIQKLLEDAASLVPLIRSMPQAVIAAVNGPAVGGGLALAMAADVRICSESAFFSTAFINLGLAGFEMGLSVLLPSVIGPGAAFELAMSGGRLSASQAVKLNMVREVTDDSVLLERAEAIAAGFAKHGPGSVRMTKALMSNYLSVDILKKAIRAEIDAQMQCVHSEENRTAVLKFLEKSKKEPIASL